MCAYHRILPAERFAQHAEIYGGAEVHPESARYLGGFGDETLRLAGASLLAEIRAPTSTGRHLGDGVSLALTARIIERYVGGARRGVWARPLHVLAEHRLRRVLQFMAEHLEDDIGLDELAAVAGLNVFHFHRMFANAMGGPPHRYLGQTRLERAKTLLALADCLWRKSHSPAASRLSPIFPVRSGARPA